MAYHLHRGKLIATFVLNLYPHRKYAPIKSGDLDYVPLQYTAKKIFKLFADYFKPYKSPAQRNQDFKQPLVGVSNLFIALYKIVVGFFSFSPTLFADGLFTAFRAAVELATTPLAWFIKPLTRGLATWIHDGYKKIEENSGLSQLAEYGQNYLAQNNADLSSPLTIYELLAVCGDIHRKFTKSQERGQNTDLSVDEHAFYDAIRKNNSLDARKLNQYFALFAEYVPVMLDDANTEKTPEQENTFDL